MDQPFHLRSLLWHRLRGSSCVRRRIGRSRAGSLVLVPLRDRRWQCDDLSGSPYRVMFERSQTAYSPQASSRGALNAAIWFTSLRETISFAKLEYFEVLQNC